MLVVKPYWNVGLIVCKNQDNIIGVDNKLPWHLPKDLERFKCITINSTVVMGRNTWESLPIKPLPDRRNVVISSTLGEVEGAMVFKTLNEALSFLDVDSKLGKNDIYSPFIWVIGGRQLYEEAIPYVSTIVLTTVFEIDPRTNKDKYKGKSVVKFPDISISLNEWTCVQHEQVMDVLPTERTTYKR